MAITDLRRRRASTSAPAPGPVTDTRPEGCVPIAEVSWRQRACFMGRVRSMRVQPWADVPTLECTLIDETGGITVVFLGRRRVAGIALGRSLLVDGMAGAHHGKLAVLNPEYTLLPPKH